MGSLSVYNKLMLKSIHHPCITCAVTPFYKQYQNHGTRCSPNSAILILTKFVDHDDVIKWKHFPRYWPFVRGIHRSQVNSPHKGQWRWALIFYLLCAWINAWVNNRETGDLRRHHAHYDVTVMAAFDRKMSHDTRTLHMRPQHSSN